MDTADEINRFWLDEVGPKGWYERSDTLDDTIRTRFGEVYRSAREGARALWLTYPSGTLAYLILLDQFPRNMFRASAQAFATDKIAVCAAKMAIEREWDLRIDEPARQFFYLPLMHSEVLADQDRCVRLVKARMPQGGAETLRHACAHREIIRRFGRFPHRNPALERETSTEEQAFLDAGGYRTVLEPQTA